MRILLANSAMLAFAGQAAAQALIVGSKNSG
jgi:hypothetical protein